MKNRLALIEKLLLASRLVTRMDCRSYFMSTCQWSGEIGPAGCGSTATNHTLRKLPMCLKFHLKICHPKDSKSKYSLQKLSACMLVRCSWHYLSCRNWCVSAQYDTLTWPYDGSYQKHRSGMNIEYPNQEAGAQLTNWSNLSQPPAHCPYWVAKKWGWNGILA